MLRVKAVYPPQADSGTVDADRQVRRIRTATGKVCRILLPQVPLLSAPLQNHRRIRVQPVDQIGGIIDKGSVLAHSTRSHHIRWYRG